MKEIDAIKSIKQLDGALESFDRTYEMGRWLKNQGLLSPSDQSELEGKRANIYLNQEAQNIVGEFINTTTDPLFHRVLFVLDRLIKYAKVESNKSVYQLRSTIEQAVVNYPITISGKKVTRTKIRQILRSEADAKLRLEAFHCYDDLSRQVEKDLLELVALRNSIAHEMGYAHYGELGLDLQGLNRKQIAEWFSAIIQSTDSIYQSFLNESAEKLSIPHLHMHDLSYAITQLKTLPDKYFLSDRLSESIYWLSDRINITDAISRVRFDYVDIPFQGLCVTIHVPDDIRILINPADGHTFYITFFHEIGHAMHSSYMTQPYHMFRDEPGPFCEGMAQTMARFVDDPEWLLSFAKLPEELAKKYQLIWRTYNIYHMRALITQAEFEWKMYAVPGSNMLNSLQTVEDKYLKASTDNTLAWADNIYWASYPFYVQNYVVADMIASQTHHSFRKIFGRSIQKDSGAWLAKNYWNLGGSIEWSDKIMRATGTALSPDELILEMVHGYPPE